MTANKSVLFAGCLAAVLGIVGGQTAGATLARAASFDEKVEKADSIVLGHCVGTRSEFDQSHRWIVTYSTFRVDKSLKGQPAGEVTVVTPGGQVGDLHQSSVGIPAFREGDQNVLFVRNTKAGPTVLYFDQGTYGVAKDDRGEMIVAPVATDLVRIDEQRGIAVAPETPRTLREFQNDIDRSNRDRNAKAALVDQKWYRQSSFWSVVTANKLLITVALAGLAIAASQFFRR